ncbi:MAG: MFS transporter [Phyllobacteriaceae bacterium]|nr:MFS transporter [Phyllobacteriaceae bacterium]
MTPTAQNTSSATLVDGPSAWLRLALCIAAATVINIGMWAAILVLPNIQADYGVDRADASTAFTMAMFGFSLGNLVLGDWVDRYGIAPILAGSAVVTSICYALSTLAPNIWIFAALQLPIGFATGAGFGPLIADVSHWFRRYRGIAIAATACGNYISGTIWPLVLKGPIADEGWRFAFLIIAIACTALILPVAFLLRQKQKGPAGRMALEPPHKTIPLKSWQLTALLLVAGFGCCMAMAMPQVHIVAYCVDLGFGAGVGAEMLSMMLAAGIASRLLSGWLADRIGGVPTLLIGSVLQGLALFLYIPFNGLASLYIVSLIFGLSQGGIVPSYAIIVREYLPAEEAGKRIGIIMVATVGGMAVGGWASGFIFDLTGSYRMAFIHGIAWNIVNMAIMVFILLQSRPAKPQRTSGSGLATSAG